MNVLVMACHRIMEKTAYFTDCAWIPFKGGGGGGGSLVLVLKAVDILWTAGGSLLRLAIFSQCCVVDDNGRSTYL